MKIIPIKGIPKIKPGDNLTELIIDALKNSQDQLANRAVLVVAHKIVSIAEGRLFRKVEIKPSEKATRIARLNNEDPVRVELAIREAQQIIRETPVLITKTRHGIITDYSGIDKSNAPSGYLVALPKNPDRSAHEIHKAILDRYGIHVPVIISDTQGRPWRKGAINIAIGLAGMSPFIVNKGKSDIYGRTLHSSLICLADELASAAELVMGQANEMIPIVLITHVPFGLESSSSKAIIRPDDENLFL